MDVKKIALLVGALIIAAVTAITAKNMFSGASAPKAEAKAMVPAGPQVLVATRSLPVGTLIDAEALRFQTWPEGLVQPAYYIKGEGATDPVELIGTVVRTEITAGQPVTQGSLIQPGERGFLAAALGPGMRAVTVSVSDTGSVAGFVFPGDRVDIVLTQEVNGGGDGPPLKVSETVIRNIRVLATDRRTNVMNESGKPVPQNISMVTFEATPRIAEKIAVAQTFGSLSLSLRPLADTTAELERAIASGEVNVPEGEDPKAEKRMLLAIANKPSDGNSTYTVGADVSRFQRSTVPPKAPAADAGTGSGSAVTTTGQLLKPTGPTVRVARGNNVTDVPVGAK
ncbi:Flp pilus assembly protein CpaB [Sphingosinicella rhizophila]|uniref:Flp pilus assembly protein CpaB n=1 Tax=Sphingosinicella rhizophila TaxID=3050082 RepID=A0ABU3Q4W5_9SPHN|nr:Flp pilus assembly protein CpaB [Sphingosinicella sp. GR2756]MDT9598458.1 Flp pilus assembly protein CpaB [Sphingosinicella sp. GR2756]